MTDPIQGPVHLVGIGGMHMSAIAQILRAQDVVVTGSDLRPSPLTARLQDLGATVFEGHAAVNVGDAALVVTTVAAKDDNPELVEARRRGIPVLVRAEMVARLIADKRVIAVAGSHGKTTTSSLIAFILSEAGRKPMYMLGGESIDLGGNAAWGEGDVCVVEADEYGRAFLEYDPAVAVITNIEPDHLDYYGTPEAYIEAFEQFAQRVIPGGVLLVGDGSPTTERLASSIELSQVEVETFGLSPRDHWMAGNPKYTGSNATFAVLQLGKNVGQLIVNVPGEHFVIDTLAAAAVCLHEGVDFGDIAKAVSKFRGARRRFELVGEAKGVLVMDDYAHHPTEVRATLSAARARFGGRRIIGVFQPHTYSRTAYLWDEWTTCWDDLDALVVLETYAAREPESAGRGAEELARAITRPPAVYARDFDDAAEKAANLASAGDVIFTIGAGDVDAVGPRILEVLK
ncbi:MAG TPA: UDP-N-acetylmuramate--L-alanine ligase [Tepidiformaceae bacterium]|nr:UDP-N-acetylmuramate--L-alanine ligase [Tepidiformaceae bacterium]